MSEFGSQIRGRGTTKMVSGGARATFKNWGQLCVATGDLALT